MAITTWSQIKNSDDFHNETPEAQKAIADDYFNKVIAPQAQANGDDINAVYSDFSSNALKYSADEVASRVQSQLDKAQDVVRGVREDYTPPISEQLAGSVGSVARGLTGAAASTVNIIPEMADMFASTGSWLGEKVGLGDGTYTPATRIVGYGDDPALISLAESTRPRGTAENVFSEALPFLFGAGEIKAPALLESGASKMARMVRAQDEASDLAHSADMLETVSRTKNKNLPHPLTREQVETSSTLRQQSLDDLTASQTRKADADRLASRIPDDWAGAGRLGLRDSINAEGKVTVPRGTRGDRLADIMGRNLQAATVGTLAANSDGQLDAGNLAKDFAVNTLGGAAVEGLMTPVISRILGSRRAGLSQLSDDVATLKDLRENGSVDDYNLFVMDRGLGSVGRDGRIITDSAGYIVPETNVISGKADVLSEINQAGGKVGTQTLREQLNNSGELLDRYGIGNTVGENVGLGINKVTGDNSLLETFGLREAGLDSARANATLPILERTGKDLERAINEFPPNSAESGPYAYLQAINKHLKDGNLEEAASLSKSLREFEGEMEGLGMSRSDIDDIFSLNRDYQTIRKFMEKAKASKDNAGYRDLTNLVGRIASVGGVGLLGGPVGAAAVIGGRYALSKANTANVGRGLREVGDALRGEYNSRIPSLSRESTENLMNNLVTPTLRGGYESYQDDHRVEDERRRRSYEESSVPQVAPTVEPPKAEVKPQTTKFAPEIDRLYKAIAHAETGGLENRFIRTRAPESAGPSSAYGPAQITTTLMQDFVHNHGDQLSAAERKYANDFIKQGNMMLNADPNDPVFGYGGTGVLTGTNARKAYASVARKILTQMTKDYNGDLNRVVRRWRGNDDDTGYFIKVRQGLEG